MIQYDKSQNILTMKGFEDKPLGINPLDDIKDAYHRYLFGTDTQPSILSEDLKYFWDACRIAWGQTDSVGTNYPTVVVDEPKEARRGMVTGDIHYTVRIITDKDGMSTTAMNLPFMDSRGVFNRRGALKVLMNYLQASEDISYDAHKRRINIQLGNRNIYLEIAASNFKTATKAAGGNNTISFDMLALALMAFEGISDEKAQELFSMFDNYEVTSRLEVDAYTFTSTAAAVAIPFTYWNLNKNFVCSSETRDNLNRALSLDRAIGEYLYDDAYDDAGNLILPKGTRLTRSNIKSLKRAKIWHIKVQQKPAIIGCKLADSITITHFPKGLHIGNYLRRFFTLTTSVKYLSDDVDYSLDNPESVLLTINKGTKITPDIYEFIMDYGVENFPEPLYIKSGRRVMEIKPYVEVLTNRTFWGSDIGMDEQWYAYNKKGDLMPQKDIDDKAYVRYESQQVDTYYCYDGTTISSYDALALISLAGWYVIHPDVRILGDKDVSLLKKVRLADAVFSKTFRDTVDRLSMPNSRFFSDIASRCNQNQVAKTIHNISTNDYSRLEHEWFATLEDGKYFEAADQINPVAVLAHVTNISTFARGKNSVAESQRLLSLPYYGRVCPYETPASGKIGLTNHKTLGCKIEDGVMKTVYYPVENGVINYNAPTYMSAKKAESYILTYPTAENIKDGNKLVGTIMAICPNNLPTGDATIVREVSASEVDYVFASPIQQISTTAALVPFLGADDPARISFSLSMQKQAIFCQDNQKPRVMTDMYRELANILPYYTITAEYDGKVTSIDSNSITVTYNVPNTGVPKAKSELRSDIIYCPLEVIGDNNITTINENYGFNKADEGMLIIAAGPYMYKAPYKCEIIEVYEDTPEPGEEDKSYFVIREVDTLDTRPFKPTRVNIMCKDVNTSGPAVTFTNYFVQPGDTFEKGKILARASIFRDGVYAPARNALVAYMPTGYNYEDAVELSENCATSYTSISMREESVSLSKAAKNARLTLHSGYIREGAVVATPTCSGGSSQIKLRPIRTQNISGYAYESRAKNVFNGSTNEFGIRLLSFSSEKQGDKMAGRHGNKGVCAHVCKNSDMPMFANGKIVDICLNPCGVPSRMNLGQNLEAHLGFVAELLDIYIVSNAFNGATHDDIQMLMSLVYDLANSDPSEWSSVFNKSEYSALSGCKSELLAHITQDEAHINRIKEWEGAFERTGTARLYDPNSQRWFENPIAFGYAYFLKLEQEVDEKVHARAGMTEASYVDNTQQPVKGRSRGGGQKQGEMELVTLAAYGARELVHEITNSKSDNTGERYLQTCEAFGLDPGTLNPDDVTPRANDILRYYLESMGVYTDLDDFNIDSDDVCSPAGNGIADISRVASCARTDYSVGDVMRLAVAQGMNSIKTSGGTTETADTAPTDLGEAMDEALN